MLINQRRPKKGCALLLFIVLWHYFFSSSFVLRLDPKIFWPTIFAIAFVILLMKREVLQGTELTLFKFLYVGFLVCFLSADAWTSIINDVYFFVYLGVAAMIGRNITTTKVMKTTLGFCVVHLICIYIQVFVPNAYKSIILPLLPSYSHADILYQMTYNASFYGFTVQTSMAAMYMTIGAICAAIFAKHSKRSITKILYIVLVALFLTGVLFTTRRGSLLALCLVLAYIYFDTSGGKFSKIVLLLLGIAFLLSVGVDWIPGMQGLLDKFDRLSGNMMNGRQTIWGNALSNFWNYPLFGYGVGNSSLAGGGALIDNAYLAVLVERGLIGSVIWFIPIIWTFIKTYSKKKHASDMDNIAQDFSLYIQLLFVIMSMIENYFGQALAMFIYYVAVLCEDFTRMRGNYEID